MTTYQTRNARPVKDGGGILPDIVIKKEKYGMIIGSLATERLFFNYVTNYRFSHDTIPIDYTFSDTDFMDFTNFLNDKEYK